MHIPITVLTIFFLITNATSLAAREDPPTPAVTIDNFARVAFDMQALTTIENAKGVNSWTINRSPVSPENQQVIHANRDMLYMAAVVDIKNGAQISVPVANDRYTSFSIINRDGYTKDIFYGGGTHSLDKDFIGSDFVYVIGRIMVDAENQEDIVRANRIQDGVQIFSGSDTPFPIIEYDMNSYEILRRIFSELTPYIQNTKGMFGNSKDIDSLRFLVGTSIAWGNLPEKEALYIFERPNLPVSRYYIDVPEVPGNQVWSITVYKSDGYFQKSTNGKISVNSRDLVRNEDGSTRVHFGGCFDGRVNCLGLTPGWNYAVRIYRPNTASLSGEWKFPRPKTL